MTVAILAGGKGTRLGPMAVPKLLVDVHGKPFAAYQLAWLRGQGVTRVVYCLGYRSEPIVQWLGDGGAWGVRCEYVMDAGPQGTGGALRHALPLLGEQFGVLYGDVIQPTALGPVVRAAEDGCLMTTWAEGQKNVGGWWHDAGFGVLTAESVRRFSLLLDGAFSVADVYRDVFARGELKAYAVMQVHEVGSKAGLEAFREHVLHTGLSAGTDRDSAGDRS
jgi:MurNAc alpha-1-phosphate uridylyltransferase